MSESNGGGSVDNGDGSTVYGFARLSDMARVDRAVRTVETVQAGPLRQRGRGPAFPPGHLVFVGKTNGAINKGTSGSVDLWVGSTSSTLAASSPLVTLTGVYNRFADAASGKWVFVVRFLWGDELFALEC